MAEETLPLTQIEKQRARNRRWYHENKDRARENRKRWAAQNPERIRELGRRWRINNPERAKELDRIHSIGRYSRNPEAVKARIRKYRAADPKGFKEKRRVIQYQYRHGMSPEGRAALLASQGDVCGVCLSPSPGGRGGWHTDHCHVSGKVRGMLCHHCNIGLGHAKDSIDILRKMIAYLEKHQP